MLQTFGNHAQCEGLDASNSFVPVLAIRHDAGQSRHLGEPASIVLSLNLNRERHAGNVPFNRLSNKAMKLLLPQLRTAPADETKDGFAVAAGIVLASKKPGDDWR